MKIKKVNETFFSKDELEQHFEKHVKPEPNELEFSVEDYATKEEYDNGGDWLTKQRVGKSDSDADLVGFITTDDRILKYNKKTHELVIYVASPKQGYETISFYKVPLYRYKSKLRNQFKSELNYNK